jgi:hypothetical protein
MQVIKGNGIESQNQGQRRRPKLLAIKPPIREKAKAISKTARYLSYNEKCHRYNTKLERPALNSLLLNSQKKA